MEDSLNYPLIPHPIWPSSLTRDFFSDGSGLAIPDEIGQDLRKDSANPYVVIIQVKPQGQRLSLHHLRIPHCVGLTVLCLSDE